MELKISQARYYLLEWLEGMGLSNLLHMLQLVLFANFAAHFQPPHETKRFERGFYHTEHMHAARYTS